MGDVSMTSRETGERISHDFPSPPHVNTEDSAIYNSPNIPKSLLWIGMSESKRERVAPGVSGTTDRKHNTVIWYSYINAHDLSE